jgi:hypothetical protein
VHDDCGPLRAFWTKREATEWLRDGMRLIVAKTSKQTKTNGYLKAIALQGEALF